MQLKKVSLLVALIGLAAAVGCFAWYRLSTPTSTSSLAGTVSTQTPVVESAQVPREIQSGDQHPLDPLIEKARDLLSHFKTHVRDYTAVMVKRERNGGRLSTEVKMEAKIRCRQPEPNPMPISVYLKFLEPASTANREVIWVDGRNNGNLISHEGGFKNWTRLSLDPTGMLAMAGNKYPITEVGLRRMLEKLIEKGLDDRSKGACQVQRIENQKVGDRPCTLYQIVHPEKDDAFDFHIAQIFIDDQRQIPLRYAAFMWPDKEGQPPPLEEEYTFLDVQLNVDLTDADFDPDNPNYDFP